MTKKLASKREILCPFSDYELPNNYRNMDNFPMHVFVLNNANGDEYYAKFNIETEQGQANLTNVQAQVLRDFPYQTSV